MSTTSLSIKSPIVRESLWIVMVILITLAITRLFMALSTGNGTIVIYIHDTYLVFDGKWFFWIVAVPLLFLIFLARIIRQRNHAVAVYGVALVSGLVLVIGLTWLGSLLYQVYPKTGMTMAEAVSDNETADGLRLFAMIAQPMVLIAISWIAYQWGQRTQASHAITSQPPTSSSGRTP